MQEYDNKTKTQVPQVATAVNTDRAAAYRHTSTESHSPQWMAAGINGVLDQQAPMMMQLHKSAFVICYATAEAGSW